MGPRYGSGAGRVSMPDSAIQRCISSASAAVAKWISLKSTSAGAHPATEYHPAASAMRSAAAFSSARSTSREALNPVQAGDVGKFAHADLVTVPAALRSGPLAFSGKGTAPRPAARFCLARLLPPSRSVDDTDLEHGDMTDAQNVRGLQCWLRHGLYEGSAGTSNDPIGAHVPVIILSSRLRKTPGHCTQWVQIQRIKGHIGE